MPRLTPADIRNVVLVGHHGAGKTTLAEALLAATGAISRQGSVDKGSTVCDFEPEETSRQLSVSLAIAPFTVEDRKVNLLDAPGYADFAADLHAALGVADLAVVVVSATDGVQAQTEDAWRAAAALGLPRVVVVNKLDRERADFDRTLAEVRAAFGAGVAPVELPVGSEAAFRGVIDLLDDRATLYDLSAGPPVAGQEGPIPEELAVTEHEVHEQLVEGIVVGDDDLMTRYLDGEIDRPRRAGGRPGRRGGLGRRLPRPVLLGGDRGRGRPAGPPPGRAVPLPRPAAAGPGAGRGHHRRGGLRPRRPAPRGGLQDGHRPPRREDLALQGALGHAAARRRAAPTPGRAPTSGSTSSSCCGARRPPRCNEAVAGDFVAVPRLAATATGDTLAPKGTPVTAVIPAPEPPALSVAVHPASRADDDKLMSGLQRLCEEDGSLRVSRVDETHQTVLGVAGEVHLAVTLERLSRKFGVAVEREEVLVPYRETITKPAGGRGAAQEAVGRPRPVRRLPPAHRAAAPGRGVRLPRRGGGRGHPPPVHPGGGEGGAARPWPRAGSSATPWSTWR